MEICGKEFIEKLSGYKQAKKQKAWLTRHGIPFVTAKDGFPRVSEEAIFGDTRRNVDPSPDFGAIGKDEPCKKSALR